MLFHQVSKLYYHSWISFRCFFISKHLIDLTKPPSLSIRHIKIWIPFFTLSGPNPSASIKHLLWILLMRLHFGRSLVKLIVEPFPPFLVLLGCQHHFINSGKVHRDIFSSTPCLDPVSSIGVSVADTYTKGGTADQVVWQSFYFWASRGY